MRVQASARGETIQASGQPGERGDGKKEQRLGKEEHATQAAGPEQPDTEEGQLGADEDGEVDLNADPLLEGSPATAMRPYALQTNSPLPDLSPQEERRCIQVIDQVLSSARRVGQPNAIDPMPNAAFERQMQSSTRPPEDFLPGRLRTHRAAWRHYFAQSSPDREPSKQQRMLLGMIEDGVKFKWVGARPADAPATPQQRRKRHIVTQMLRQAEPTADPEQFLTGPTPHKVQFPNHRSAAEYADMVRAEIQKCLRARVVAKWSADMGKPTVINGLRVVMGADGKKFRLCMNPMYPNLFMEIPPLKYESILDVRGFVQKGDCLFTTDDKSGYWNLLLHPSMYRYVAFQWDNVTYYWPTLAFGLAPACWVYSTLKLEMFRPLRACGMDLAFLIDDCLGAARSVGEARFQCRLLVELMTTLGFTLSLNKCQLQPSARVRFLGFLVDSENQTLSVPEDKVEALDRFVRQLEEAPPSSVTYRQVAQVAGKIMAMSPAVSLAPLHARVVGLALAGRESWDDAVGDPGFFTQRARLFMSLVRVKNGKAWWAKGTHFKLRAVGDASDVGTGGFLPDGELGPDSKFSVPFTAEQAARQAANDFSSTEREVTAAAICLQFIDSHQPGLLRHRTVQYQTDSQAAMFCVLGMKGAPPCLLAVDAFLMWCAERDCELETVWYPRETPAQQAADLLSKHPSLRQWALHQTIYEGLWAEPGLVGRRPYMDLFADEGTTKVAGRFFSPHWSPNSSGVNALAHSWSAPPGWSGPDRPLLYLNPPFELMGAVVRKLRDEAPDCVLIAPVWPRWWAAQLGRLPHYRGVRQLPTKDIFVTWDPVKGQVAKTPHYGVQAWYFYRDPATLGR